MQTFLGPDTPFYLPTAPRLQHETEVFRRYLHDGRGIKLSDAEKGGLLRMDYILWSHPYYTTRFLRFKIRYAYASKVWEEAVDTVNSCFHQCVAHPGASCLTPAEISCLENCPRRRVDIHNIVKDRLGRQLNFW